MSPELIGLDRLLTRLRGLGVELTGQEIRILLGVAARGTVRATVLSDELSLPRQTLHNGLPRLTPMYSKKRQALSMPEIPLVTRVKRPGKPYLLRLSRTGQQLFREAGLLPSEEPCNDPAG